jgi:hypothetical protein
VPEFYDDDIPLLYLGADTPALFYDNAENDAPLKSYFGLLPSAGLRSTDGLKRSARHAMNLLSYLLLDWTDGTPLPNNMNLFARSFLSLPVSSYNAHMELNAHVAGDDRGGAKEDACRIVVLILTRHLDPTGDHAQPLLLEEVVTQPVAQQAFDVWCATAATLTIQQQELMSQNAMTRQAELDRQQRQEALLNKNLHHTNDEYDVDDPDGSEQGPEGDDNGDHDVDKEDDDSETEGDDPDNVMATIRKRQRKLLKQQGLASSRLAVVRWADSQVAREQAISKDNDDNPKMKHKNWPNGKKKKLAR